jgi:predicted nucleic acid-binding protein
MPSRIYLDSCIAIYLVEEHQQHAHRLETLLESRPEAGLFVSDLTAMECLVGPFRSKNKLLEEKYNGWFEDVTVLALTNSVFVEAARLRALHSHLKTPDALHLAVALHYDCDEFWTNDTRLQGIAPSIVRNVS